MVNPPEPPPTPLILLVDDDEELCLLMRAFFIERGLRLDAVNDGRRGLARALGGEYDLVLLDVMMPGLDGFEVLRQLRRQSDVPAIMLTARTAQTDRIAGLDAGADDYLGKPFGPEELLARVRAVLRRARPSPRPAEALEVGPLRISPSARSASLLGEPLALTTFEYDLLEYLARAVGRIVSRDELSSALYRRKAGPFDRALDVHVSNLRRKLGPFATALRTVRGTGFLFGPDPQAS